MRATANYKIYRNGEFVASCKQAEDAAAICGMTTGTVVKFRHRQIIYREYEDAPLAGDSWDAAAALMRENRRCVELGIKFDLHDTVRAAWLDLKTRS